MIFRQGACFVRPAGIITWGKGCCWHSFWRHVGISCREGWGTRLLFFLLFFLKFPFFHQRMLGLLLGFLLALVHLSLFGHSHFLLYTGEYPALFPRHPFAVKRRRYHKDRDGFYCTFNPLGKSNFPTETLLPEPFFDLHFQYTREYPRARRYSEDSTGCQDLLERYGSVDMSSTSTSTMRHHLDFIFLSHAR